MVATPKKPISPIPTMFMPILRWLRDRRGLDLFGRINFIRPVFFDGVEVTVEDVKAWKALVAAQGADKPKRQPRNKHPAVEDGGDETELI